MKYAALILVAFLIAFSSKEQNEIIPHHFPKPIYQLPKIIGQKAEIELGKTLFYDPILSHNNSISCENCHSPYSSFAHTDHPVSHGIHDSIGKRNAPVLINLGWQTNFMLDGSIHHLDMQALAPISDQREMGSNLLEVVSKLQASKKYPPLFLLAYNDSHITGTKVLKAISTFLLTLISSNSKYDQFIKGQVSFTEQEIKGYKMFKKNCATCHPEPLFTNYEFANIGLPIDSNYFDFGRMTITRLSSDSLKFKTPTLRNIAYSAPYMHDGRFSKLSAVLNHYTEGITPSNNLALPLKNKIALTKNEKVDIIAFLLTLSDSSFVFNPNHRSKIPHKI